MNGRAPELFAGRRRFIVFYEKTVSHSPLA